MIPPPSFLDGWQGGVGCGVEFVNGPLFEGFVIGKRSGAVGAEGAKIDFEAEYLIGGAHLQAALGFLSLVFLHEALDELLFAEGDFLW